MTARYEDAPFGSFRPTDETHRADSYLRWLEDGAQLRRIHLVVGLSLAHRAGLGRVSSVGRASLL
jgi:hypothetical protein